MSGSFTSRPGSAGGGQRGGSVSSFAGSSSATALSGKQANFKTAILRSLHDEVFRDMKTVVEQSRLVAKRAKRLSDLTGPRLVAACDLSETSTVLAATAERTVERAKSLLWELSSTSDLLAAGFSAARHMEHHHVAPSPLAAASGGGGGLRNLGPL